MKLETTVDENLENAKRLCIELESLHDLTTQLSMLQIGVTNAKNSCDTIVSSLKKCVGSNIRRRLFRCDLQSVLVTWGDDKPNVVEVFDSDGRHKETY